MKTFGDLCKERVIALMVEKGIPEEEARARASYIDHRAEEIVQNMTTMSYKDSEKYMQGIVNGLMRTNKIPVTEYVTSPEFDKTKVDRIIVETNSKMQEIINWTSDNEEFLHQESMKNITPSFTQGVIEFTEEDMELGFVSNEKKVTYYVYMKGHYIYKFERLHNNTRFENITPIFAAGLPKERRKKMLEVTRMDRTIEKLCVKYTAIMIYATLHRETVVIDEPKSKSNTSHKTSSPSSDKILPLTPKRYIIKHIDKSMPGHHAAPEYQVEVRPTVRRLKSGKVVPVKGFVKYKDKPKKESSPKIYKA